MRQEIDSLIEQRYEMLEDFFTEKYEKLKVDFMMKMDLKLANILLRTKLLTL